MNVFIASMIIFISSVVWFCNGFWRILTLIEILLLFFYSMVFHKSYGKFNESFKESNSGRIGSYLINLNRATERLNFVKSSIIDLGFTFERVPAIDGHDLSIHEIESITDINAYKNFFKMPPEAGTIGCSLSHEKTWRKFLESDNEFAIIFEDDVKLPSDELRKIIKIIIEKKHLWDIVSFEIKHEGCPVKISKLTKTRSLTLYFTHVTHAGCYLINRKAAYELIRKVYPIKMPLDHYFTSVWAFGLKFAGVEPRIVEQKFGNSQIKISDNIKIRTPKILLFNAVYNTQRAIIHFIYNVCCFVSLAIRKRI